MYPLYRDLREKLGEPLWHDQLGVPRYAVFHPELLGIYDDWAVLFEVECEACRHRFPCAIGFCSLDYHLNPTLGLDFHNRFDPDKVLPQIVGWGDAPWHDMYGESAFDSQCAGTTMSSSVVYILEVWRKDREWEQIEISQALRDKLEER